MRFILMLFFAVFTFSSVHAANAANEDENPITLRDVTEWQKKTGKRDQLYDYEITQLSKKNADFFPNAIRSIRNLYAFTTYYEPFSDGLVDEMTRHAYTVQTSTDRAMVNKSLLAYRELLKKHIANIGVVNFAITMARVSAKFGDATYYEAVRDAIYDGIVTGYDGRNPQRAFNIVARDEEIFLLVKMGATVNKSEIYDVNGTYYNVYDITDKNGEFAQIFMNITKPVKVAYIRKYLARKEQTYSIPGLE